MQFVRTTPIVVRMKHLRRSAFTRKGIACVIVISAISIMLINLTPFWFNLNLRSTRFSELSTIIRFDRPSPQNITASASSSSTRIHPLTDTREERRIRNFLEADIKSVCPKTRRSTDEQVNYRHHVWQVQENNSEEIVVYSAFYDDRPIVGYLPWIRILGVRRLSGGRPESPLFCYIWYDEFDAPLVTQTIVTVTGRDHSIVGDRTYGQRLFSCPLTATHPTPTHVSIATVKCDPSTVLLPVNRPIRALQWQHEFGVCIESSFGSFRPEIISEWIEAYSLFGVTQINIYNASLDSSLDRIIEHYVRSGVVVLRQLPPSVDDYSEEGIRLSSPTSLNDCMMRNMYSDRFVVVVDFDEIIVPRNHSRYSELIAFLDATLNRTESQHTYSFRNAYFFLYFPDDDAQPEYLRTMRKRHRAPANEFLFGAKSFVDPRRCLSVFNHYCWVNFPGIETPVDVPDSLGLVHHYRYKCPLSTEECRSYDAKKVSDDTMLRFKSVLDSRVSAALKAISN